MIYSILVGFSRVTTIGAKHTKPEKKKLREGREHVLCRNLGYHLEALDIFIGRGFLQEMVVSSYCNISKDFGHLV